ncbi:MAG: T9SS type A sorting domain-containing protein [Cytophagaceae bacterium]|nr:T9SS type A sorting domain-containing protein [Cytophagaceae bacterium]
MKTIKILHLITFSFFMLAADLLAQTGYYDAPYVRYEADLGTLNNATLTAKSYAQSDLQSEASDQVCVNLSNAGASVEWTVSAAGDGLVVRYSVPDGQSGVLEVYADNVLAGILNLTTYYSWENLGFTNANPKMRFDEVRLKLPVLLAAGGNLKLVNQSGNIHVDFAELEPVPAQVSSSPGDAVYSGNGSDLQIFIDAHGGDTIYLPAGVYNVSTQLNFGIGSTVLKGAGMWYTEIHFTEDNTCNGGSGGLRANAADISFSGLYLTTVRNSRSCSYKAINGVYTSGSSITYVWAEHFECGAWIAQFGNGSVPYADGFTMSHCRFRNNYADGINLSKGTRNSVVEHCSFRNNGDDDMAIWSAEGYECRDNTYRYNTSENCWRASGCAIYGGYNNKAHHLLIKDNLEAGLRVNNSYRGVGFNDNGMHEFSDITIIACGTFNDLWNAPVGAIDIVCDNQAGTRVKNVKFSNISIIDSKNDAIYIRRQRGEGFYNLIFENVTIDGTGKEYPGNNANNLNWGRGYGILFVGNPSGYGYYCNMTYLNRGGNAASDINSAQIGSFSWTSSCIPATTTAITSAVTFGICDSPALTATTIAPMGETVSYIEFFVDGISKGTDNASPYETTWNNLTLGDHSVKAVAHYSPSGATSASSIQIVSVTDGIYSTSVPPVIDGSEDALWNNFAPAFLNTVAIGTVSNAADLSAFYKITRDASNLYILVDVTDDILRNDGAANWQKDGIELYIDVGNDKSGPYIASDYQYSFVWNVSTPQSGVAFAQTTKAANKGYIIEIRIPWSTLGGLPADGAMMGFDLHVEDNDSGNRDAKKVWKDATDNAWQSTMVLGTLQFAACPNPHLPLALTDFIPVAEFNFYPNPFHHSGNLKINSGGADQYVVKILDMNGKVISSTNFIRSGEFTIGENLPSGMYLLEISDGTNMETIKLIKL